MSYFSELLTFYSKRIGVNSPLIASYCGLDRVTVYRFLKGKTLPKDKDTVSKMAEFLQLTSDEKGTLAEAYECSRLGSHVYWERRYIRSFIRNIFKQEDGNAWFNLIQIIWRTFTGKLLSCAKEIKRSCGFKKKSSWNARDRSVRSI